MKKSDAPGSRRALLALTLSTAVLATVALISLSQLGGAGGPGDAESLYSGIPQTGTTLGRSDTPVTISVYEDFQCPFCGRFSRENLPPLVRNHVETGEAKVVSRPLTFLGEDSLEAATAALAAGEQDLYWGSTTRCCSRTRAPRTAATSPTSSSKNWPGRFMAST